MRINFGSGPLRRFSPDGAVRLASGHCARPLRLVAALALSLSPIVLSGCGSTSITGRAEASIADASARADSARSGIFGSSRQSHRPGAAQVSDGVYVAAAPVRSRTGDELPASVQRAGAVRLESRDPMTIDEIATRLSEITAIPHVAAMGPLGEYAVTGSSSDMSAREYAQTSTDVGAQGSGAGASSSRAGRTTRIRSEASQADNVQMIPNLSGSLSAVLDEVASYFNAEWTYIDGRVVIRDFVTRQYQVAAIPEDILGNQSASNREVWEEIEAGLETVVTDGANLSVGRGTGLVTVTARVSEHERIADYLKQINASLSRQVAFDVNVLSVQLSEDEGYNFDLAQLATQVGKANLTYSGVMPALAGAGGNLNVGVFSPDVDISTVIRALSTQGRVKVETRTGATTSNNRMVPIEVIKEQAYAARTESLRNTDGNDTGMTVTPEVVTTGFDMKLVPRILNNREIMIEYALEISELDRIRTFGREGSTQVELPEVSRTRFQQQALLNNGETLVLAGFERDRRATENSGVGNPRFPLLGGGSRAETSRVVTVITVTPRLLDNSRAIAGAGIASAGRSPQAK